jgi:MSHA biogenesis protein MshM
MTIRSFYGIETDPFSARDCQLLEQQQEIYDTLHVHGQQGGLCLVLGVPGTGKSTIKQAIFEKTDPKRTLVVAIGRTLHTYANVVKILCQAFGVEHTNSQFKCEKALIERAWDRNHRSETIITLIDDAHLLSMEAFRKLRLMFGEFPKNHNVILLGQPLLMSSIALAVNEDIRSRVTYSVVMRRLNPEAVRDFILGQLDRAGLGHNVFSENALGLIARSADGVLRKARNLSVACMLHAAMAREKTIDIDIVNKVLIQPHWRKDYDLEQF